MKKFLLILALSNALFSLNQKIKSLQADFEQTIQDNQIIYQGKMYIQSSNLAKWEYLTPLKKEIYIIQDTLISYEPNLSQVTFTPIKQQLDFLSIIQHAKQDPQNPNLYFSTINQTLYRLHTSEGIPTTLQYQDTLGNEVLIKLKNVKINPTFPKNFFDFTPPKGVDVIKE
ncbi:hypothetical protein BBW65_03245 [Helicobacter enhydrae]|uniref:Outer membrane lipoprotein chaperone LolA n=1 Tax=Helicobacter enhydrae TaxID=222136 RepID=A0A1B1U546_9HELI|nr:LolA-like outer membrane lipoprotein chaperone [Helicobacter enhydrae]ANV97878.1 hypothetical protein BBW65_03245 [Helicobacter enhydrae]